MLANAVVVILLKYISASKEFIYTLNLYNVICKLYLIKAGRRNKVIEVIVKREIRRGMPDAGLLPVCDPLLHWPA